MSEYRVIEVLPYDAAWAAQFCTTAGRLREALGDLALRIDHIGSTSVVGLAAKPTIDIQISVASFEPFTPVQTAIESCGYRWMDDNPDMGKRFFRDNPRTTHIHVRKAGSWGEQFALLFRDYLRVQADARERYGAVKRQAAAANRHDIEGYMDFKNAVIWQITERAHVWSMDIGWEPGESDA